MLTLEEILEDFTRLAGLNDSTQIDLHGRDRAGRTPLHWMAILGDHEAIELLLVNGADVSALDTEGNSPLHTAVADRQATAVQKLIEMGADLDLRNLAGQTPLEAARLEAYKPVIAILARDE